MEHTVRLTGVVLVLGLVGLGCAPDSRAATLRGFGAVEPATLPNGQGVRFECDSPAHAKLLIHKLARDMALSATVPSQWTQVTLANQTVPVLVRPGLGAYLVLAKGRTAYCFTVPLTPGDGLGKLSQAFAAAVPFVGDAQLYDAGFAYPAYLDKWSTAGIGSWYTPYNPFDDNPKGLKDIITPHFEYMNENNLSVHASSENDASRREVMYFIHKFKRPFHLAQWLPWDQDLARLDPFDLTQPGNLFSTWEHYYGQLSYAGDRLQQYQDWVFQHLVKEYANDPQLVGWDEPHGEIGPSPFQIYWDYGARNRAHFLNWLRSERGYTLKSLGEAWYHDPGRWASWEQVPIPFDYSLYGYDEDCLFADSAWRMHTGEVVEGLASKFQTPTFDDSRWVALSMPGGDLNALQIDSHRRCWFRGTITVPAAWLKAHGGRLHLVDATLSGGAGQGNPDHLWFNGADLGGISGPGGMLVTGSKEITGLVHAGTNSVVFCPATNYVPGGFFLSPRPIDQYPGRDSGANARYVDWRDYIAAGAVEEERHTIQTIRGTDPNRPIKVMAAADKDLFNVLMSEYGCYPHNTGDEAFFMPWDRRGGYPYGIPGSAESSASMVTADNFRQWLGWFTFEGLNAFDNFIDIEAMMYTPVRPLWKQYFPYLHLANRYDLKQPQVGLLWSGQTNRLNPGNMAAIPFVFDLGRGDLQTLGYSYAYLDEPALQRGLAAPYKVLWDCGTWVMSPRTVADLRKYVEGGGTFVAIQETGRHSLTERDAWPIESLTGFKVSEVRPMGGFVSILNDQPLLTKLAGQNFLNEGRSIDYSGFNYADKCVALTPAAAETEAIARYRDGAIAIGMRRLGKGRVIVLGTPFWRNSYDKRGLWWPSPQQSAFVQDLLTGLGAPPDVPADNQVVWRDRYVANNGTEEYLVLWNPSGTETQSLATDWQTSLPATQVFDPKTGEPVAAKIDGRVIHLSLTLKPLETLILAVQSPCPPADTVSAWFAKTALWWKASLPGKTVEYPALPMLYAPFPLAVGKIVAASAVTPESLASLSSAAGSAEGWDPTLTFIRPAYDGLTITGDQRVLYRSTVATPASWKPGGKYILRLNRFSRAGFTGEIYLNGKQVGRSQEGAEYDVSGVVRFQGANTLVIAAGADGFAGDPDLWRRPRAADTLSLGGDWTVQLDEDHGTGPARLPGSFIGLFATQTVVVPAAWSQSHVYLNASGDYARIAVNDRVLFYSVPPATYMDVTPWIKFGQPNLILLQPRESAQHWKPGKLTAGSLMLERIPVEELQPAQTAD